MTYEVLRRTRLEEEMCRYGTSKLLFRGPKRSRDAPYVAFVGGTETYGKFIRTPFPARIEHKLGLSCLNLGQPNAGVGMFLEDPAISAALIDAQLVVIQVTGAHNISNQYYSVHPRYSDRITTVAAPMYALYPEMDFADVHYTIHLLQELMRIGPERFDQVQDAFQTLWVQYMQLVLQNLKGKSVVFWFSDHPIPTGNEGERRDPLFVSDAMITQIAPFADAIVELVVPQIQGLEEEEEMIVSDLERAAAAQVLKPNAHKQAADRLTEVIQTLI